MSIKKGNKVKVEYTGRLEDGTVFDTSEKHGPLEVEVGAGKLIKGFDNALIGMEKGEEKEIKIPPSEAYGDYNPQMKKEVPRDKFPKEELKPGMVVMSLPNGLQMPIKIIEVKDKTVTIDLNHPLVGKTLIFNVKILEIS